MILARRDDGVELDDDPDRVDLDTLEQWLSVESYWATGRPREVIARSLALSWCFAAYDGSGAQAPLVAFARAVTDRATFAWLCDVFVGTPYRGHGIGTWLVGEAVAALQRAGVSRVLLATADAHDVYARVGFEPLATPERWMEIDRRPTRGARPAT